jgi:DNA-binding MarR family transcriptional regulator
MGQELSPLVFSRIISSLIRWNLIQEEPDPGNNQEKLYSITPDGELALFVYSARLKKRGVASTPGLT